MRFLLFSFFLISVLAPAAVAKGELRKPSGPIGLEAHILDPVREDKTVRIRVDGWVNDQTSDSLSLGIRVSPGLNLLRPAKREFTGPIEPRVRRVASFRIRIQKGFSSGRVFIDATRVLGGKSDSQSIAVPLTIER